MNGAPDPKEVGEMARLIRMMNEGVTFDDAADEEVAPRTSIIEGVIDNSDSGVDPSVAAMKNILLAFRGDANPVAELTERASNNRELREALITENTDRGTRIGSWEIIINEDDQGLKSFDVINVHTGEPIATELSLYDAAHGITRALNEGEMINSNRVRNILSAEFDYVRARQNAAQFRDKARVYEHTGDHRRALMEDRFDEALGRAKTARQQVVKLSKL